MSRLDPPTEHELLRRRARSVARLRLLWPVPSLLLICGVWPVSPSYAQKQQASQQETRSLPESFHLRPAEVYLSFEGEYETRRVRSSRADLRDITHKNRDMRLRELCGITLDGDIYDPNLVEYHAQLAFGLSQTRFEEWEKT